MIQIPTRSDVFFYFQQVVLDNVEFILTFDFNQRADSWYIGFGADQSVLAGIRISGNEDILKPFHHLEVPPGILSVLDLDGLGREPTKDNFGDRVILTYEPI